MRAITVNNEIIYYDDIGPEGITPEKICQSLYDLLDIWYTYSDLMDKWIESPTTEPPPIPPELMHSIDFMIESPMTLHEYVWSEGYGWLSNFKPITIKDEDKGHHDWLKNLWVKYKVIMDCWVQWPFTTPPKIYNDFKAYWLDGYDS